MSMKILSSIPDNYVLATSVFDFISFNQLEGYKVLYGTRFIIKGRSSIEQYTLVEGMSYNTIIKPYLKNKQLYVIRKKS